MAVNEMALVGEGGPELVFLSPSARTMPVITVGSANTIGLSIKASANTTGDFFVDTDVGIMSVWNGTGWDDIGPFSNLQGSCMPVQPGNMQNIGDIFIDDTSRTLGIWNGTDWAMVDLQGNPFLADSSIPCLQSLINCSCPYCGTLNPPDTIECGAGCWNGCGAPLEEEG